MVVDETALPGYAVPVPQQDNDTDCGVFMLESLERLIRGGKLGIPEDQDFRSYSEDWFDATLVPRKRLEIQKLILAQKPN